MFLTESWFWRGTQSAIFYYVSCAPCVEFKYKQKRRKDAARSEKEKAEIITKQPGRVVQPGPFQTNPDWAEEIIMGPGPPKGWKRDKILKGFTDSMREKYREKALANTPRPPEPSFSAKRENLPTAAQPSQPLASPGDQELPSVPAVPEPALTRPSSTPSQQKIVLVNPSMPGSETTSATSPRSSLSDDNHRANKPRPSLERRLSTVVLNLKDTFKGWNVKRYEREDEVLTGFNERLARIWDKARSYGLEPATKGKKKSASKGRKRALTNESDKYYYQGTLRNPEINEMHPPTVSKLPATREEAAWMLLPPPSAAVMAGKVRPSEEPEQRWPLSVIGRDQSEWDQIWKAQALAEQQSPGKASTDSTPNSKKTPILSNSSSEEEWTDEEEDASHIEIEEQRATEGRPWYPYLPNAAINKVYPSAQAWLADQPKWMKNDVY